MSDQSEKTPVRLGMIGAGLFARDAHVPALYSLDDDFVIAAVYSRTADSANKLNALLPEPADVYTDLDALLARDDIDAVDVLLPITLQPAIIQKALAAGKHVLSEKPVAPDVATGQDLLAAYQRHPDQVWMVAENYRYEEPFVKAAQILRSGEIGRPIAADWALYVDMSPSNKYYNTAWRQSPDYPGGFLLDGGVHHIAALRMVLGEVTEVSATTIQHRDDLPPADTLSAALRFANGALASYSVTYAGGAPWYGPLQVVGERGALRILRDGEVEVTVEGETRRIEVAGFSGIENEFKAFAAAIRDGDAHRNGPDEALQDVAVVEALLKAGQTGQHVTPARIVD